MTLSAVREAAEATFSPMREQEIADHKRQEGKHVIRYKNHYWETARLGFYVPVHWMGRLTADQIARPVPLCTGFRAALCDSDASMANGSVPVHLLENFVGYSETSLSSSRRRHLRKCRQAVRIVQVLDASALGGQAYDVLRSAIARTQCEKLPTKEDYLGHIRALLESRKHLLLAGFMGDSLGGYVLGRAVDGTAYLDHIYFSTEALKTHISIGLTYEFVQACQRTKGIREIVHSQHTPENPSLSVYKEGLGFRVTHIPTRMSINPAMAKLLRWRYPNKYYRLTGRV